MAKEKKTRGATPLQPRVSRGEQMRLSFSQLRTRVGKPLRYGAVLLAAIVVVGAGWYLREGLAQWSDRFPIRQISVVGNLQHVDKAALKALLQPYMKDNYFSVDMDAVKQTAESMTWIDHADVRKEWPNTLIVSLQERIPVANWGENQFLSAKGEIFSAEHVQPDPNLPTFIGKQEQASLIAENYVQMQKILQTTGLTIKTLAITDRITMTLQLNNGLTLIVDDKDSLSKLKRFTEVYQLFSDTQRQHIQRVDLRYDNGLAIKWKKGNGDTNAA